MPNLAQNPVAARAPAHTIWHLRHERQCADALSGAIRPLEEGNTQRTNMKPCVRLSGKEDRDARRLIISPYLSDAMISDPDLYALLFSLSPGPQPSGPCTSSSKLRSYHAGQHTAKRDARHGRGFVSTYPTLSRMEDVGTSKVMSNYNEDHYDDPIKPGSPQADGQPTSRNVSLPLSSYS